MSHLSELNLLLLVLMQHVSMCMMMVKGRRRRGVQVGFNLNLGKCNMAHSGHMLLLVLHRHSMMLVLVIDEAFLIIAHFIIY